jgi:hypothetical protein
MFARRSPDERWTMVAHEKNFEIGMRERDLCDRVRHVAP